MEPNADKRERLIEAAGRLLHRQGYRNTTLADLADESGVPLGNVYYYFRSKRDLLGAVAGRLCDDFAARVGRIEAAHATPRERLLAFLDSVIANRATYAQKGCPVGSLCQELGKDGQEGREALAHALATRSDWAAAQFRAMGFGASAQLGMSFTASVQGIILMANAMRDPDVVSVQAALMKQWVEQLQ